LIALSVEMPVEEIEPPEKSLVFAATCTPLPTWISSPEPAVPMVCENRLLNCVVCSLKPVVFMLDRLLAMVLSAVESAFRPLIGMSKLGIEFLLWYVSRALLASGGEWIGTGGQFAPRQFSEGLECAVR